MHNELPIRWFCTVIRQCATFKYTVFSRKVWFATRHFIESVMHTVILLLLVMACISTKGEHGPVAGPSICIIICATELIRIFMYELYAKILRLICFAVADAVWWILCIYIRVYFMYKSIQIDNMIALVTIFSCFGHLWSNLLVMVRIICILIIFTCGGINVIEIAFGVNPYFTFFHYGSGYKLMWNCVE